MGDVFRGGNQNVIASIDSKKVSTKEFVDYLQKLNLNEEQIKNLPKTDAYISGYWKIGLVEDEHQLWKNNEANKI